MLFRCVWILITERSQEWQLLWHGLDVLLLKMRASLGEISLWRNHVVFGVGG